MENYEAGELQMVKASEDATRKNVTAAIDHSNETRKIVRDLEKKIEILERSVLTQENIIAGFRQQLGILQAKVLGGGPTA